MPCRRSILRLAALALVAPVSLPAAAPARPRTIYVAIPGDVEDLAGLCRAAAEVVGVASAVGWIEGNAVIGHGDRVEAVRIRGWEAGSAADLVAVVGPMSSGRVDRLDDIRTLVGEALAARLDVGLDEMVSLVTPTDPFPTDIEVQVGGIFRGKIPGEDQVVVYLSGGAARQLLPFPIRSVVAAVLEPGADPAAVESRLSAAIPGGTVLQGQ